MKIKTDFVTNSSSASFIIQKVNITGIQKMLIKNHLEFAKKYHPPSVEFTPENSGWTINETEDTIEGNTSMDNFDMFWFLKEIGIDENDIEYERS